MALAGQPTKEVTSLVPTVQLQATPGVRIPPISMSVRPKAELHAKLAFEVTIICNHDSKFSANTNNGHE